MTELTREGDLKFRLLIIGRAGTGKSSLIKAIFGPALADAIQKPADINKEMTAHCNRNLILHYYEPYNMEKFGVMAKFIVERSQEGPAAERLHAIWFCASVPCMDGRLFEEGDEMIFMLNRNKVPIIVVFTKFDLFVAGMGSGSGKHHQKLAEKNFKDKCGEAFETLTKSIAGQILPYALVTITQPETLYRLVEMTMKSVDFPTPSASLRLARSRSLLSDSARERNRLVMVYEDSSESSRILLAAAHGVNMPIKLVASVRLVEQKYWSEMGSSISFRNVSLQKCIDAIHKDIITIWNPHDLDEFLLSHAFRRRMMLIVEDVKDTNTMQSKATVESAAAGLARLWTNAVYKNRPELVRCLTGYVVDLTLVLQAMFQVLLQDQFEGQVTADHVDEIIYEFHCSEKKKIIHHAIRTFAQHAKDDVVEKIQLLLKENQMTQADTRLNKDRPPLLSLLTILRFELTANGLVVNRIILDLVCELLKLPDFRSIVPGMDPLDVELLLDFILYLLQKDHLSTCGVPDANRKARRLMAKLISEANVIPQSLYITNVSFDADGLIGIGGHGRVLKGIYEGRVVALKMLDNLYTGQTDLFQEFCKEALIWRSLRHDSILPLLGIFKEQKLHFLVSPLLPNGTLMEWRRNIKPLSLAEVHRLILEVAEGIQYLHSEGIVHGDISGDNVLLDSNFHCRIIGFGLTRHSDATATGTLAYTPHYAAPELFLNCRECNEPWCDGYRGKPEVQKKSMATDVYAFGCLYYAIFFSSVPYEGELPFRIGWLVTTGERPQRLEKPKMQESLWNLINDCWKFHAADRPPMHQIVETIKSFVTPTQESYFRSTMPRVAETSVPSLPKNDPLSISVSPAIPVTLPPSPATSEPPLPETFRSVLGTLRESATLRRPTVNKATVDFICELLNLPEHTFTASELTTSDVELLLDVLLALLRSGSLANASIQSANKKARRLMLKLITVKHVIPRSLFITQIKTETDLGAIATGGFGSVFTGDYQGQLVALKVLNKVRHGSSLQKDFCKEALAWWSLSHRFILPLLGIYEEKSCLFLVSPYMTNGTLTRWRRERTPDVVEIHRLMLEVVEAVQYLHSEGIIHGDLHGQNILLDPQFHCQITDFGLTRHSEATVAWTTKSFVPSFAAPELFGMCGECSQQGCDGRHEGHEMQHAGKTMKTDVYAFGCLYYTIFFDIVPFHGKNSLQIMWSVTSGDRPDRLQSPRMDDDTWNLIESCWKSRPSERPTMEEIMRRLTHSS